MTPIRVYTCRFDVRSQVKGGGLRLLANWLKPRISTVVRCFQFSLSYDMICRLVCDACSSGLQRVCESFLEWVLWNCVVNDCTDNNQIIEVLVVQSSQRHHSRLIDIEQPICWPFLQNISVAFPVILLAVDDEGRTLRFFAAIGGRNHLFIFSTSLKCKGFPRSHLYLAKGRSGLSDRFSFRNSDLCPTLSTIAVKEVWSLHIPNDFKLMFFTPK